MSAPAPQRRISKSHALAPTGGHEEWPASPALAPPAVPPARRFGRDTRRYGPTGMARCRVSAQGGPAIAANAFAVAMSYQGLEIAYALPGLTFLTA